jgi:hypothetical protein
VGHFELKRVGIVKTCGSVSSSDRAAKFLILRIGSFDEHPRVEYCAGADEGDEVRPGDRSPGLLGVVDERLFTIGGVVGV